MPRPPELVAVGSSAAYWTTSAPGGGDVWFLKCLALVGDVVNGEEPGSRGRVHRVVDAPATSVGAVSSPKASTAWTSGTW